MEQPEHNACGHLRKSYGCIVITMQPYAAVVEAGSSAIHCRSSSRIWIWLDAKEVE